MCNYFIRDIRCVWKHLNLDASTALANALVSSRLDYYLVTLYYWYHPYYRRLNHIFCWFFINYKSLALKELINCVVVLLCILYWWQLNLSGFWWKVWGLESREIDHFDQIQLSPWTFISKTIKARWMKFRIYVYGYQICNWVKSQFSESFSFWVMNSRR